MPFYEQFSIILKNIRFYCLGIIAVFVSLFTLSLPLGISLVIMTNVSLLKDFYFVIIMTIIFAGIILYVLYMGFKSGRYIWFLSLIFSLLLLWNITAFLCNTKINA